MAETVSHPSGLCNAQLSGGWPNDTVPGEVFHKHLPYQVPGCNKHLEQPNSRDEGRTAKLLEARQDIHKCFAVPQVWCGLHTCLSFQTTLQSLPHRQQLGSSHPLTQ